MTLLALALLPSSLAAQSEPRIDVAGGWSRLVASDASDWSGPWVQDARWAVTSITASWSDQGLAQDDRTLWYRKRVALPASLTTSQARAAILIGPVYYASYEIYADGSLIGSYGRDGGAVPYPRSRLVELPRGVVEDGTVLLALKIRPAPWASEIGGEILPVVDGMAVSGFDRLQLQASLATHEQRERALPRLLFALLAVAAGLFHLGLFFGRTSQKAYLWFGTACIAFAINALAVSPWTAAAVQGFSWPYRLNAAGGHLAVGFLLLFLWDAFERPRGRWMSGYIASHMALAALVLIVPLAWSVGSNPVRFLWLFPGVAAALIMLGSEVRDGHPDALLLAGGALAILVAEGAEFLRLSGAPLPAFLPYAGFAVALFTVAVMLAAQYARRLDEADMLRRSLERRVQERTSALTHAMQQAAAANEAKRRFLTNMSHEFRTPLNAVIGFSNVLLKKAKGPAPELGAKEADFLERIRSNGTHLLALVDRILNLSRIESGSVEVESSPVDVGALVNRLLADTSPLAKEKGIRLSAVVPTRTEAIVTDPVRLREILSNLVENAIKFTEEGSVTVTVLTEQGRPVSIEVRDTGVGIAPDRLAEVLEPFSQADDSTGRRHEGAGLGLSIARGACELLGFHLGLESEPGVGSVAYVDLDPARSKPARGVPATVAAVQARAKAQAPSRLSPSLTAYPPHGEIYPTHAGRPGALDSPHE